MIHIEYQKTHSTSKARALFGNEGILAGRYNKDNLGVKTRL